MENVVTVHLHENDTMECVEDSVTTNKKHEDERGVMEAASVDDNDKPDMEEILAEMERKNTISYAVLFVISLVFITVLVIILQ